MGTLYLVATPIGNLQDVSARAQEILASVSLIACEDTRKSLRLLNYYGIRCPLLSCHAHNEERVFRQRLLPVLKDDKSVAYVSEAGTPGISDPGNLLVELAYEHAITVCPIPGPSAVSAVLSVAGLHGKGFVFEGFLPRKRSARLKILQESLKSTKATVFFESQHRICSFLEELATLDKGRKLLIAREISKMYEEYFRGEAAQLLLSYQKGEKKLKGEFVILVYPIKN